jgi:TorA maturation chaperone TorD
LSDERTLADGLDFAVQELRPWLTDLAGRLAAETGCPFYALAARLALAILNRLRD